MSKVDVVLGLQWGDEGKGKITDYLCDKYDIVARFQGGGNADHTLQIDGKKYILRTLPSGVFHKDVKCVIGSGCVINPIELKKEIESLSELNLNIEDRLFISNRAFITLPTHVLLDELKENTGKGVGSTKTGIGPTFTDKVSRIGLMIGDIFKDNFSIRSHNLMLKDYDIISKLSKTDFDVYHYLDDFIEATEFLKDYLNVTNTEYLINNALLNNEKVLAEGAQGTMLDLNFGSYPNVTSNGTTTSAVCSGLGIAPQKIGNVYGTFKPYLTRVGGGTFPTYLNNEISNSMIENGHEYDVHGRERKCGWLDLPLLKYSIMLNGVTELFMMKVDVLDTFDEIEVCIGYEDGNEINFDIENRTPIYKTFKGWNGDYDSVEFNEFVSFLETELNTKITHISNDPGRNMISLN